MRRQSNTRKPPKRLERDAEQEKEITTILSENEFVHKENKAINIFVDVAARCGWGGWLARE